MVASASVSSVGEDKIRDGANTGTKASCKCATEGETTVGRRLAKRLRLSVKQGKLQLQCLPTNRQRIDDTYHLR
jgi:hypothetical protein